MKRFLFAVLIACNQPATIEPAHTVTEPVVSAHAASPEPLDDSEPSLCYAGRIDYREICRDAGHPWKHSFDERCVGEAAKPGQPSTGLLGGVPFLSTGLDPTWPSALYYLDCTAQPAPGGVMLLCCP